MAKRLDPLPLENRRESLDSPAPPRRLKITSVSLVSHIGLCIAALALPIFAALLLMPAPPQVWWVQRTGAVFGLLAMAALPPICIGLILRKGWSRQAMQSWAMFELVWETIKLLITVFYYAPVYTRLMTTALASQQAAALSTQPATQPTAFASFTSYGIYLMAVLTWAIFFGYALGAWKAMRMEAAKRALVE